jgi:hypothetical protein
MAGLKLIPVEGTGGTNQAVKTPTEIESVMKQVAYNNGWSKINPFGDDPFGRTGRDFAGRDEASTGVAVAALFEGGTPGGSSASSISTVGKGASTATFVPKALDEGIGCFNPACVKPLCAKMLKCSRCRLASYCGKC